MTQAEAEALPRLHDAHARGERPTSEEWEAGIRATFGDVKPRPAVSQRGGAPTAEERNGASVVYAVAPGESENYGGVDNHWATHEARVLEEIAAPPVDAGSDEQPAPAPTAALSEVSERVKLRRERAEARAAEQRRKLEEEERGLVDAKLLRDLIDEVNEPTLLRATAPSGAKVAVGAAHRATIRKAPHAPSAFESLRRMALMMRSKRDDNEAAVARRAVSERRGPAAPAAQAQRRCPRHAEPGRGTRPSVRA